MSSPPDEDKSRASIWLSVLIACSVLATPQVCRPSSPQMQYEDTAIGFRYSPAKNLKDVTERSRDAIRRQARAVGAGGTTELLLAMASNMDDRASDWCLVKIESDPRVSFSDADDLNAEAKMSALVAGAGEAQIPSRTVVISGQRFAVSLFAHQEGAIRKRAVVFTTVRRGKLLSFAFAANSPEQLKALAETMKTVQFF